MQEEKRKDLKKNEKIESTRGYVYETPACDVYENEDSYKIYFDLPGVEKDDISLKVEKDVLSLIIGPSSVNLEDINPMDPSPFNSFMFPSFIRISITDESLPP